MVAKSGLSRLSRLHSSRLRYRSGRMTNEVYPLGCPFCGASSSDIAVSKKLSESESYLFEVLRRVYVGKPFQKRKTSRSPCLEYQSRAHVRKPCRRSGLDGLSRLRVFRVQRFNAAERQRAWRCVHLLPELWREGNR